MKKRHSWKLFGILSVFMLFLILTAASAVRTEAASQTVKTKTISTSKIKKVSKSKKTGAVLATAQSASYAAVVKGTAAADEYSADQYKYLEVTRNGKTVKTVNLASTVKKALGTGSNTIEFYQLTCINNVFYITGAYGSAEDLYTGDVTYFYLYTKNGSTVKVKTIDKQIMQGSRCYGNGVGWRLFYANGQYVAAAACISCDLDFNYVYYTSKNLKSWTERTVTPTMSSAAEQSEGTLDIHPAYGTSKGMVFTEVVNAGHNGDYELLDQYRFLYTTNFTSYKKVTTLNSTITTNGNKWTEVGSTGITFQDLSGSTDGVAVVPRISFKVTSATEDGYTTKVTGVQIFSSNGINKFKTMIDFTGAWTYYSWNSNCDNMTFYLSTSKKNYVYIGDVAKGTSKKYSTKLEASRVGAACYDGDWCYTVYDGQYLLVSKNGNKTVYKINTKMKNISNVFVQGSNLVLARDNAYDYYIPISTIQKAVG